MIRVLVGIIVLAIVIYIGVLAYQHHVNQQLKELRDRKEKLDKESLSADIKKANRLSLTGKSLQDFNDLQKSFEDIDSNREQQFSEQLEAGEAQTKNFQIFAARETRNKLAELVTVMEQEFNSVKTGLQTSKKLIVNTVKQCLIWKASIRNCKTLLAKNFHMVRALMLKDMLMD